jgi:threonylcarbamoyladenosine tRNA methylthiotransferase MtaB
MKVFLDMVGCRLNQSEIEEYAAQLRQAGHSLISDAGKADLVIINTCSVTAAAASDSRQKIRQASRAGAQQIVVTGCHATLNPSEITILPGVRQVIGNQIKDSLVPLVLDQTSSISDYVSITREPIPGNRMRTRAFIKVQDGCDNYCTYCITRLARGKARSRSIRAVLEAITSAQRGGAKEIILTGVHLGSWGHDFPISQNLKKLIEVILKETSVSRLRLSSLEPWDISPEFFELWRDRRLCQHLHLPLQSGCGSTLKRMGRKIEPEAYDELVQRARRSIPGLAVTTDIITGFPGETEDEFTESLEFVKHMHFANGHVFTFSPRPGTPAAMLPGRIPSKIAKQRNAAMRQVFQQFSRDFRQQQIGKVASVLWEKVIPIDDGQSQMSGLTDNYVRVKAITPCACQNQIMEVKITGISPEGLLGVIQAGAASGQPK